MRMLPPPLGVVALAAMFAGSVFVPQLAGWTLPGRALDLAALTLAAILTSWLRVQHAAAKDRTVMAPSFVVVMAALLMFGPHVATLVAAVAALTPGFLSAERPYPRLPSLIDSAVAVLATEAGGQAYRWLTHTADRLAGIWPWQGGLIAAAVITYFLTQGVLV